MSFACLRLLNPNSQARIPELKQKSPARTSYQRVVASLRPSDFTPLFDRHNQGAGGDSDFGFRASFGLRPSGFGFRASAFGLRISDFGFKLPFTLLIWLLLLGTPLAWAGLPLGWSDADLGAPGLAGSAAYTNGNWTVTGGGAGLANAADQFNFASTSYGSDGSITAQVTSLPTSGSEAGVMFRNDTTAGAANVNVVVIANQGVSFQWRSATGAPMANTVIGGISAPVWLQLNRSGDNYSGYYSADGSNWVLIGTQQIFLNGSVLAGLAVSSDNNSALSTATFTNVSLTSQAFGIYRQLWTNLNASSAIRWSR